MVCLLPAAVPEGCLRRRTMGRPAPSAFCRPAHWSRGGGQPLLLARKYKSGEPVLWLPLQQGAQGTLSRCFAVPLKELPEVESIGNTSLVKLPMNGQQPGMHLEREAWEQQQHAGSSGRNPGGY